jgi:hypothetical protein
MLRDRWHHWRNLQQMILSQNYRRALGAAGLSDLDAMAKAVWRDHVDGELSEPEAAGLIAAIEGRRGHAWIRAGLPGPDDCVDKPERRRWQAAVSRRACATMGEPRDRPGAAPGQFNSPIAWSVLAASVV